MGRRALAGVRVPACAKHPGSRVVRAGLYRKGVHKRQLWCCHPATGEAHRFTERLPRTALSSGHV